MKKLIILLLLSISFSYCSKGTDQPNRNLDILLGNWIYVNGTFTGNGVTGIVDPYFNQTKLEISLRNNYDNYQLLLIKYRFPFFQSVLTQRELMNSSVESINQFFTHPFWDIGIKRSNSNIVYYDYKEILIDNNQNEILLLDYGLELFTFIVDGNHMYWTRDCEGYSIAYNFVKD